MCLTDKLRYEQTARNQGHPLQPLCCWRIMWCFLNDDNIPDNISGNVTRDCVSWEWRGKSAIPPVSVCMLLNICCKQYTYLTSASFLFHKTWLNIFNLEKRGERHRYWILRMTLPLAYLIREYQLKAKFIIRGASPILSDLVQLHNETHSIHCRKLLKSALCRILQCHWNDAHT